MPDNTTEAQGATPVERADDVNTDVNTDVDATSSQRSEVTGAEIVFDNVVKKYPGQAKAAVGGMSLRIPAGETVMFVGPSGCGKTTSLKMINRLIDPTSGTITIDGKPISESKADDLRRAFGVAPDQPVNAAVVAKLKSHLTQTPAPAPATPEAGMQSMEGMDHSQMGHGPAAPGRLVLPLLAQRQGAGPLRRTRARGSA